MLVTKSMKNRTHWIYINCDLSQSCLVQLLRFPPFSLSMYSVVWAVALFHCIYSFLGCTRVHSSIGTWLGEGLKGSFRSGLSHLRQFFVDHSRFQPNSWCQLTGLSVGLRWWRALCSCAVGCQLKGSFHSFGEMRERASSLQPLMAAQPHQLPPHQPIQMHSHCLWHCQKCESNFEKF